MNSEIRKRKLVLSNYGNQDFKVDSTIQQLNYHQNIVHNKILKNMCAMTTRILKNLLLTKLIDGEIFLHSLKTEIIKS